MALSFVLLRLASATPLQAFAAGASLCSTSIGTTFTILSTTGLAKTRLGVVLGSAAMMDDVAGLVMVQIISNLGSAGSGSSFDPVIVIRPILVAFGFALGLVLVCRFVVAAFVRKLHASKTRLPSVIMSLRFAFVAHMCYLIGLVTGAKYAGTSGLLAAYLAGASISWLDEMLATINKSSPPSAGNESTSAEPQSIEMRSRSHESQMDTKSQGSASEDQAVAFTGEHTFETYCKEPLKRILSPLFFASIGFSIPITKMFQGEVIWRGVVYTILMSFGKIITGIWLIRITVAPLSIIDKAKRVLSLQSRFCIFQSRKISPQSGNDQSSASHQGRKRLNSKKKRIANDPTQGPQSQDQQSEAPVATTDTGSSPDHRISSSSSRASSSRLPEKPRSLYPASILGLAMVARGEIGYLIASLAETDGIFSPSSAPDGSQGSSELYLVVTWAITLCTIIGPVCVGTLVKRVKALQAQRTSSSGVDPLGTWGVT